MKKLLNLKTTRKEKLFINTFSEKSSFLKEFDIEKIKIKGVRDFIIEAACIPSVCTPFSNQQCSKDINVFPHFKNLKSADDINGPKKKFLIYQSIRSNAPFLYTLKVFVMFSGERERVHWERMG